MIVNKYYYLTHASDLGADHLAFTLILYQINMVPLVADLGADHLVLTLTLYQINMVPLVL